MDQPKEGELPPVQETSFDVATMNVEPISLIKKAPLFYGI